LLGSRRARAQQHFERALRLYDEGESWLAIADLTEAIRCNRRRAEYYSARGLFWAEVGCFDHAEADFEAALRIDPTEMIAHYGLGMVAFAEERYEDAVRRFAQAIECDPNRGECYYFRSVCHYHSGALEPAEIDMDFARQLMAAEDPRQLDAARWLGMYQRERKKVRRRRGLSNKSERI
jgi:lipoprotein NlpI